MTILRRTSSALALAAAVISAAVLVNPASATQPAATTSPSASRGRLVSSTLVRRLSAANIRAALAANPAGQRQIRTGIAAYRLVYTTIDPFGKPTLASGLAVVPTHSREPLHLTSYEHGTLAYKGYAPSTDYDMAGQPYVELGGAGYAVSAPDYLGLGVGPGLHPYFDLPSEVSASLDMLRATRTFAVGRGIAILPAVAAVGFSQGGPAAMALGRVLQSGHYPLFRLASVAGISGPYDLQHAQLPAAMRGTRLLPAVSAFYLAYWTTAENRIWHFYDQPREVFRVPGIPSLFDGTHRDGQILRRLPPTPRALLTRGYVDRLEHLSGRLLGAIRSADHTCSDWTPDVPVRLYYTPTDEQVTPLNSRHCQAALRAHGVDAPMVDLGATQHLSTPGIAVPEIIAWWRHLAAPATAMGDSESPPVQLRLEPVV